MALKIKNSTVAESSLSNTEDKPIQVTFNGMDDLLEDVNNLFGNKELLLSKIEDLVVSQQVLSDRIDELVLFQNSLLGKVSELVANLDEALKWIGRNYS